MAFSTRSSRLAFLALFALPSALAQDFTFTLSPASFTQFCLAPASATEGAKVVAAGCDDESSSLVYTNEGQLKFTASNLCVDVHDGDEWNGNYLQVWGCYDGNTNQMFDFHEDSSIEWQGKNYCWDLTDGVGKTGTHIQVWQCYPENTNQKWDIIEIEEVDECPADSSVLSTTATPAATVAATNSSLAPSATAAVATNATGFNYTSSSASNSASALANASASALGDNLLAANAKATSSSSTGRGHKGSSSTAAAASSTSKGSYASSSAAAAYSAGASASASASKSSSAASSSSSKATTSSSSSSSGYLMTSGTSIVTSSGTEIVLRGVNIGGWLVLEDWMCGITDSTDSVGRFALETLESRFGVEQTDVLIQTWQDNWLTSSDFANVASLGFNLVRLPFSWRTLMWENGTWRDDPYTRMDWAIAQAKANGLYVIPTFHIWQGQQADYSLISENSDAGQAERDEAAAIWKQVAAHYVGESQIVAFDIINEPTGSYANNLQQDLYNAVRASDPNRMIVMESISVPLSTYGWTNVVYSAHEYLMMGDDLSSNQAAYASGTGASVSTWAGWNIPSYVGEFMASGSTLTWLLDQLNNGDLHWSPWCLKTVNMGRWGLWNFGGQLSVNVNSDSFSSIQSAWSNMGSLSQQSAQTSALQSAAGATTKSRKRALRSDQVAAIDKRAMMEAEEEFEERDESEMEERAEQVKAHAGRQTGHMGRSRRTAFGHGHKNF